MESSYRPTIGLEIHAELKTATKMFCRSKNDPDELRPNVNICPVCLAHPGTLPVINREAVRHVLRVGTALGATLADYTEFDRKNYFYPDLPKGYQISQYEYPLVSGGQLAGVAITRVHLEEDTASSVHDEGSGTTTIDFNRAGVPLMELVTEPVIHSAEDAGRFARELQLLLRALGVSEANMEKGEMRVEANVSVGKGKALGTKVEIKNLNSFRIMERAVEYEIKRQSEALERGEAIVQETRGWDEKRQATFPQRVKEGSADYRYFPDPDLPSLRLSQISGFSAPAISRELPELPEARRGRYEALGIKGEDAELYVRDERLGAFLEALLALLGADRGRISLASNYLANDLVNIIRDMEKRDTESRAEMPISPRDFISIIELAYTKKISSRAAKDLLAACVEGEGEPMSLAKNRGLLQEVSESETLAAIDRVIAQNPGVVADYRAGKANALQYLIGQGMKATKGAANPELLRKLLEGKLKA